MALQVLLKHSRDVKLDDLEVSKDFLTIFYRSNGLQVVRHACCCNLCCLPRARPRLSASLTLGH